MSESFFNVAYRLKQKRPEVRFVLVTALEAVLQELIDNRAKCEAFGREVRKIVKSEFSANLINRQTFEIWNELTEVNYETDK